MLGIIEQPKLIEEYWFGAEAMIAHGGEKYRTHQAYVAYSLKFSFLTFTAILAGLVTLKFAKEHKVWKADAVYLLAILVLFLLA